MTEDFEQARQIAMRQHRERTSAEGELDQALAERDDWHHIADSLGEDANRAEAERDRALEVAGELAEALRAALNADSGPLGAVEALAHYEALKEEAK